MITDIKEVVRQKYTEVVTQKTSCCDTNCCTPNSESFVGESYENLSGYAADADLGLGCGIPTEFAKIQEGNIVLDLGSGAGNDVFVARSLVGASGKVIGVDMTEAMVQKANENKAKLGFENVEFHLADIEQMPLEEETIDVAISNCVMNLVPDKQQAYAEVFRVLKKGGHFSISDIVLSGDLPVKIQQVAELYAGCVSGAMPKAIYLDTIREAGFANIQIVKEREIFLPDNYLNAHLNAEELKTFRESGSRILSITVYAEKPCCAPTCCN